MQRKTSIVHVQLNPQINIVPLIREPSFKSELEFEVRNHNKGSASAEILSDRPPMPISKAGYSSAEILNVNHLNVGFNRCLDRGSVSDSEDTASRLSTKSAGSRVWMRRKKNDDSPMSLVKRFSACSADSDRQRKNLGDEPFKVDTPVTSSLSKPSFWFRRKDVADRQESHKRSFLCKDLGGFDCEGWLWKKQESSRFRGKKWMMFWCVLAQNKLTCFKKEGDKESQDVIHLPGFRISPAPEVKKRKFAFKAHHSGSIFYFNTEAHEDMVKWMNKMALASLGSTQDLPPLSVAGFHRSDISYADSTSTGDSASQKSWRSESDEESLNGSYIESTNVSPTLSAASSREDLVELYRTHPDAILDISGSNKKDRRSTILLNFSESEGYDRRQSTCGKLIQLQRTLKDKEAQLRAIEKLLQTDPITHEVLLEFKMNHASLLTNSLCEGSHLEVLIPDTNSEKSDEV